MRRGCMVRNWRDLSNQHRPWRFVGQDAFTPFFCSVFNSWIKPPLLRITAFYKAWPARLFLQPSRFSWHLPDCAATMSGRAVQVGFRPCRTTCCAQRTALSHPARSLAAQPLHPLTQEISMSSLFDSVQAGYVQKKAVMRNKGGFVQLLNTEQKKGVKASFPTERHGRC